ncbi:MAG: UvrD-helicase domain-containing protein [Alphaproteobacteria bacterium]|nr:UvrD-helicase domain-containing protein [Alphaproteobacteria bacterium]
MSDPFELTGPAPGAPASQDPRAGADLAHLEGLNESQRAAVEATEGPVLVLAGAGTGKTRVLVSRFAHILVRRLAGPGEVLAVTFTNRAAGEMRDRVATLLARPVEGWWVGTFHALGARIVRAHAEAVGLTPNFTILDEDDQLRLVKQFIDAHGIDEKRLPARAVLGIIQRWKDRGLTPDKVSDAEGADAGGGRVLALYSDYQDRLKTVNAADFGDLLLHTLTLFQDHPEVLAGYQRRFRYILVDEYQDTNVAQYLWLRFLAQAHRNLCCVGDDDQSIYSWRGAEVGNILRFEGDFPGARVVRLERNYRSTSHILGAASALIANNEGRLGKTLWTDLGTGEKVRVLGVWDGEEEARVTGEEIETLHAKGHALNEMAVLVRAGFQTREFEERLITLAVPYRVIGGPRFYERQEIRDAVAYLRVIAQPGDDLAFERIVNVPKRGLGQATLQTVHRLARADGVSLTGAARRLAGTDELRPRARKALAGLLADFERWRGLLDVMAHTELMGLVLDESGYTAMWQDNKAPDAPGRLENLRELVVALEDFEDLTGFLEHVSLVMENEESAADDKVTLMTLHGAKGLEFDTIFLPGWEEGLFPHQRALDDQGVHGLEEERRLAHVGLTRARKRAIVSFAANRRIYGRWQSAIPSRFIDELPADHIDRTAAPGLYGSAAGDGSAAPRAGGFAEDRAFFTGTRRRRQRRRARLIEDVSRHTGPGAGPAFEVGQRVFHQKFGYGKVVAADGNKLEIAFEKAGTKMVMGSFVEAV